MDRTVRRVLGVDGGGTKTTAAIMDDTGKVLGKGIGGSCNFDDYGVEVATRNLGEAIEDARQKAGLESGEFDAVFFGFGGVSSAQDRATSKQMALSLKLAPEAMVQADDDARIALAGGLLGQPGFAIIAGTGSICIGKNTKREVARAGGWGPMFDDVGSGHWLGLEAMKAAVRAFDGRGKPTVLLEVVQSALGLGEMREMLHRLYVEKLSRSEVAALAPLVLEAAEQGDQVARKILEASTHELAQLAQAVAKSLGMVTTSCELAQIGGLWKSSLFRQSFASQLSKVLPHIKARSPEVAPELGACLLALEHLGISHSHINLNNPR